MKTEVLDDAADTGFLDSGMPNWGGTFAGAAQLETVAPV